MCMGNPGVFTMFHPTNVCALMTRAVGAFTLTGDMAALGARLVSGGSPWACVLQGSCYSRGLWTGRSVGGGREQLYNSFCDCTLWVSMVSHAGTWVPCCLLGSPRHSRVFYILVLFADGFAWSAMRICHPRNVQTWLLGLPHHCGVCKVIVYIRWAGLCAVTCSATTPCGSPSARASPSFLQTLG